MSSSEKNTKHGSFKTEFAHKRYNFPVHLVNALMDKDSEYCILITQRNKNRNNSVEEAY